MTFDPKYLEVLWDLHVAQKRLKQAQEAVEEANAKRLPSELLTVDDGVFRVKTEAA